MGNKSEWAISLKARGVDFFKPKWSVGGRGGVNVLEGRLLPLGIRVSLQVIASWVLTHNGLSKASGHLATRYFF